jgi:hypothetical protein
MNKLDDQISSAFTLLALLLVFVIGYFAAFLPVVQELLDREIPNVTDDKDRLASKLRAYRTLVAGVLLLAILTGAVLTPLTRRVISVISLRGPFPTIEAGLVLIDIMLLAAIVMAVWLECQIWQRIREVSKVT